MKQWEEAEEVEDNSIHFELPVPKLHIAVHIVFVDSLVAAVAQAGYQDSGYCIDTVVLLAVVVDYMVGIVGVDSFDMFVVAVAGGDFDKGHYSV